MSWPAQLAADLLSVDGLQPVTLERSDGSPAVVVAHALRRAGRTSEAATSGGTYTADDTIWHLPAAELNGPPRLGDRLVDAEGVAWTVLSAERQSLGARWRCTARNLAVAAGLDQQIVIQRASWSQASDGAPIAVWSDWRVCVAGHLHWSTAAVVESDRRTQTVRRWQVYLADDIELDHNYRLVHAATTYRIVGQERHQAIDHLLTLSVEPVEGDLH